jgi:hypothetical protein
MKTSLILFALLIIQISSSDFTKQEVKACKTAENIQYLNQVEKDVLYYINLVRINPQKFSNEILKPYISKSPEHSKRYSKSLIRDLKRSNKKRTLQPTKDLFYFAKHHAKSTGLRGETGHRSTKGKSFKKRSQSLINKYELIGENIHYGSNNALEIVIDLLVDDGVKGVGHRVNILTNSYVYCSVSIQKHKNYTYNCVIDFAGKKI